MKKAILLILMSLLTLTAAAGYGSDYYSRSHYGGYESPQYHGAFPKYQSSFAHYGNKQYSLGYNQNYGFQQVPQGREWVTYNQKTVMVPKTVYQPVVHGVKYQPVTKVHYKPVYTTNYIPQHYSYIPNTGYEAW